MKKILIDETELRNLIDNGKTIKEIAVLYNTSDKVVSARMKEFSIIKPHGWRYQKEMTNLRQHPEMDKQWLISNWV